MNTRGNESKKDDKNEPKKAAPRECLACGLMSFPSQGGMFDNDNAKKNEAVQPPTQPAPTKR